MTKRKHRSTAADSIGTVRKAVRDHRGLGAILLAAIGVAGGLLLARRHGGSDNDGFTGGASKGDIGGDGDTGVAGIVPPVVETADPSDAIDLPAAGHPAPDLAGDTHPAPGDRAVPQFRPDMNAPISDADRAALAPATIPVTPADKMA